MSQHSNMNIHDIGVGPFYWWFDNSAGDGVDGYDEGIILMIILMIIAMIVPGTKSSDEDDSRFNDDRDDYNMV